MFYIKIGEEKTTTDLCHGSRQGQPINTIFLTILTF
jgi:hypothetical protein